MAQWYLLDSEFEAVGCVQVQQRRHLLAALLFVLLGVATSARGVRGRPRPAHGVRERQAQKLVSGQDVQAGYTSSTDGMLTTFTLLVSSQRRAHHIGSYVSSLDLCINLI